MHFTLSLEIILASIVVFGVAAQWLAWRIKLPAIVFLLLLGILGGPVFGIITPDKWMGELLTPLVSLSVAIILFEGSLTLHGHQLKQMGAGFWQLIIVGVAITMVLVAAAAHYLADVPWEMAWLIGAICTVTGPTVIAPMLRAIRPSPNVANLLRWEGIIVDPIGAILAVLVFEFIITRDREFVAQQFLWLFASGLTFSAIGALGMREVLRRHWVPWYLRSVVTLGAVIAVFSVSNAFSHESGLLTVTLMGVWLANMKDIDVEDILSFKENITLMLVSVLFVVLAARLDVAQFSSLSWGLPFFLLAVLLIRPLAIFASLFFSRYQLKEKLLLSWVAPRGIVAASVASLFTIQLQEKGIVGAEVLSPIIFSVIIMTVVLQSLTSQKLAVKLGVAEAEPKGVLVLGCGSGVLSLAKVLKERNYHFMFCSADWSLLRPARMEGFPTYNGRLLSEHADHHIELTDMGYLWAISDNHDQNILACLRFRAEFGADAVVTIRPEDEKQSSKHQFALSHRAERIMRGKLSPNEWDQLIDQGATWRTSRMTANFNFKQYTEQLPETAIIVLAITPKGRLRLFTQHQQPQPKEGWTVVALIPKDAVSVTAEVKTESKTEAETVLETVSKNLPEAKTN